MITHITHGYVILSLLLLYYSIVPYSHVFPASQCVSKLRQDSYPGHGEPTLLHYGSRIGVRQGLERLGTSQNPKQSQRITEKQRTG